MDNHPKFTVLFEKLRGKSFELDKEQMSVGRKDSNDICLKDASLSGHHADVFKVTSDDGSVSYVLRDNDSTNGTMVNNVPITEHVLKHSDIILFGGVEVLYDSNSADGDSNKSNGANVTYTHTIDISSLGGNSASSPNLVNLSPFAGKDEKKHLMVQKVIIAVLGFVGLLLLAVIGFVVFKILNTGDAN